ncbi:ribonuclease domain-containing protein [Janibacter melonis]|uniref:ribonuclease domain-containing protein n=1 Tax=Janibacter melonis TaxID=262209 RepID=UPI001919E667|nr:ribonuclease domain-containing protein [Janibacter melonis]
MSTTWRQRLQVVVGVLLILLAAWLTIGGGDEGEPAGSPSSSSTSSASAQPTPSASRSSTPSRSSSARPSAAATPDSGLATVPASSLPPEGRRTLALVAAGGPFPYDRDGVTFGNRERILPIRDRGYYAEYTVPTPGESDRGARRLVVGDDGDTYYTADHYASFRQVEVGS